MKPWDIEELRRATKGKWICRGGGAGANRFNGRVSIDSRSVKAGDFFVAIKGERFDGHDFLGEAIEQGAAAVLVHREISAEMAAAAQAKDVSVLQVEDTIEGLNRLAAAYRSGPDAMRAKVIAVGGSNGKTTTKFILQTLLAEKFSGRASPKSFNNNIGMPLTLLEVEPADDYVVLEVGTNHPGEIDALGRVCRPDIAVIVSIGLEHLEFFGDLNGVAKEEAAIAAHVAAGGTLILPADAAALAPFLKNVAAQKILIGRKVDGGGELAADLTLTDVRETMAGTTFSINGRGGFHLPLIGEHNAMNALMAIAAARRMGVSDEQIVSGLAKVKAPKMRMEPVAAGALGVIDDTYNANPSSMEASLKTFARLAGAGGRRVVILGDMLELGATAAAMHRSVGGLVLACDFDLFIAVGPLMKQAADAAAESGITTHHFATTAAAGAAIPELLQPGDQVLLKGSRGMALEALVKSLRAASAMAPASLGESEM